MKNANAFNLVTIEDYNEFAKEVTRLYHVNSEGICAKLNLSANLKLIELRGKKITDAISKSYYMSDGLIDYIISQRDCYDAKMGLALNKNILGEKLDKLYDSECDALLNGEPVQVRTREAILKNPRVLTKTINRALSEKSESVDVRMAAMKTLGRRNLEAQIKTANI